MIIDQLFTRPIFEEAAMASPEQLAYNRLRAQWDSYQTMTGGGGNTAVSRDPAHAAKLATIPAEIAKMAAALKAKGIDAETQYDALSGPAAAPVDANQAYGGVAEVAPPGAKAERMVRHIKQGYARDGKLTPKEKGIAFATAWKAHNAGQVEEATEDEYQDDYADEETELCNGCYVRDKEDSSGEIFVMRGDPGDRRVRIEDRHGRGWNIAPYRLTVVDDSDPDIAAYFGDELDEAGVTEAAQGHTIEAHGVRGMDRRTWHKTFKNTDQMIAWAEKHDAEIVGTRDLEQARHHNLSPANKGVTEGSNNDYRQGVDDGVEYFLYTDGEGDTIKDVFLQMKRSATEPKSEKYWRGVVDGMKSVQSEEQVEKGVAEGFFDQFRKKQQNYGGIDVSVEKEDNNILVKATANGRELGRVLFTPSEQDDNLLVPLDLEVGERYRGQGIGATMYDYVKSLGYTIRRSQYQTDAGAGFWDKHKSGKNVWEQGVAEGLAGYDVHKKSTSNNNSSPELRGITIPGDMKHPGWKEPTWSFQEVAEKLGVSPKELQQLALSIGNFPKKVEGLTSRYGSKAYYPRSEIKRWVNATDIRNIIKSKQDIAEGLTEMDKSEPSAGRDTGPRPGPDREAKPISAKKATRDAGRMLNRAFKDFKDSHKKKDVKESDTLMLKLQRAMIKEGRVKELADDLKTMSDADFMKKYGKAKAAIRKDMKRVDEAPVNELSTNKLAQYKTAAARDAQTADKAGDVKRGDKRFHGIVKATKKQFDNDAKKVDESRAARRALMAQIVNGN